MNDKDDSVDEAENSSEDTAPPPESSAMVDFPIVGVGASAGGLEAYRRLLSTMPENPGVSLVFVQHLDPSHQSMMADLLNRHSPLPVAEAENAMRIQPDHVYMIPPGKFLRLAEHGLFLDEPTHARGARMPIDYFLRSLAEVQCERGICIVLSGTGSDGTQGLREIKAAGGMAMVQEPREADYDGMPRAAIATGLADFVLPVEEMSGALVDYVRHPFLSARYADPGLSQREPEAFRAILNLLLAQTDYDFRCYKRGTLERRIQRRMGLRHLTRAEDYLGELRGDRSELMALFKDLLIGVTRFFRDREVWEQLRETVIAPMVAERNYDEPIRIWVPGCASGEEAYTIAILFHEEFDRQRRALSLQVYATDLDEEAIGVARNARYPEAIAEAVGPERLERYFVGEEEGYIVAKRVRECVIFATQNVISDPPFSRLDLISCRNLMIYLDGQVQERLLDLFHFALNEGGVLLLGTSEATEKASGLFERLPGVERCFRRIGGARPNRALFPMVGSARRLPESQGRQRSTGETGDLTAMENAKSVLLEAFAPPSVLVDRRLQVRYFHGPLRDYLDLPRGEPPYDLLGYAAEGLRAKLRMALNEAIRTNVQTDAVAPRVRRGDGAAVAVAISVRPVSQSDGREPLLLVSFFDALPDEQPRVSAAAATVRREMDEAAREGQGAERAEGGTAPPPAPIPDRGSRALVARTPSDAAEEASSETVIANLEYELQSVREDFQSALEEVETSNEELKASNEEMMSMNEELQSTNEELETSREELQSLNEELSTLNTQLQENLKELEASNNDLANLLASTDIATLFLDPKLSIRRFTPASRRLLNLIDGDVGRPISDLALRVVDPDLHPDCREVLRDLQPRERDVRDLDEDGKDGGRTYLRTVRPYRTADDRIDGVVVTLADITRLKTSIARLEASERQQAAVAVLGQMAAGNISLPALFDRSVELLAKRLSCTHAKVLELRETPDRHFLLRAARGFKGAEVDRTTVSAGVNSQAGYTLRERAPVIVEDLTEERRFSGPALLTEAGIVSGISVPIGYGKDAWGVLAVHSDYRRSFNIDDVNFLQAVANLLRTAITERALTREREELTERTETVLDAARIATFVWDPETDRETWDSRILMLTGLSDDTDPTSESFFDLIHPEDRPRCEAARTRLAENAEPFEETFRIIRPDTGEVRWLTGVASPRRRNGRLLVYGVNYDVTDQVRDRDLLAESEQRRQMALEAASFGTWEVRTQAGELLVDRRFCEIFGLPPRDRLPLAQLRGAMREEDWMATFAQVSSGFGDPFSHTVHMSVDGRERWVEVLGQRFSGVEGPRIVGLAVDVTERQQGEERQRLLMAELDHRVKNILANVNAIARQTAIARPDPEDFAEALEGRLSAMSEAHSLLSRGHWDGVDLKALLETELAPYRHHAGERIRIEGEAVTLSPNAAQVMCLFLHELTTNAAKHGVLAAAEGRLEVSWRIAEARFHFVWRECGNRPVDPPERRGFGLMLIEEMTASDLEAEIETEFPSEGLVCRLTAPMASIGPGQWHRPPDDSGNGDDSGDGGGPQGGGADDGQAEGRDDGGSEGRGEGSGDGRSLLRWFRTHLAPTLQGAYASPSTETPASETPASETPASGEPAEPGAPPSPALAGAGNGTGTGASPGTGPETDPETAPETSEETTLNVLIVEDVWSIATDMRRMVERLGHRPIGPATRLGQALEMAENAEVDAALLDVRLVDELVFPVAERLAERRVPFAFVSGYADSDVVPRRFSKRPMIAKPCTRAALSRTLSRMAEQVERRP